MIWKTGKIIDWVRNTIGSTRKVNAPNALPTCAGVCPVTCIAVRGRARMTRVLGTLGFGVLLMLISMPDLQAKPISIRLQADMEFGTIAGDATFPGTVTINPATGTKTVGGGAYDFGGVHSPARFEVKGDRNTAFTITLPGSVALNSGGNSMTLNNFTSSPAAVGVIGQNGKVTVEVGATLQVGAGQAAGTYSGLFDVTVNY